MIKIIKESIEDEFDEFDFGKEWVENIPKECIKGATLLSKNEYEDYKKNISEVEYIWWLRSPGLYTYYACLVDYSGDVYCYYDVYHDDVGIRPALILNLQLSNLKIGDKIGFGEHAFTIISEGLAICDDILGEHYFRKDKKAPDANDYEKSDVKKVVDDWFNKSYAEYEG